MDRYAGGKLAQGTIAYYHPYWLDHHLRDYLIAAKVFVFYISVADGVAGTALMHEVMAKTSHGTPTKAVSVIGFIGGGGPMEDANAYDEYSGVGLMGNYGKITTCADWSTNLSYLSAMRHAAALLEGAVAAYRSRVATALAAEQLATPLNRSKVYLSIGVVESGDAPVYWQDRQWQVRRPGHQGLASTLMRLVLTGAYVVELTGRCGTTQRVAACPYLGGWAKACLKSPLQSLSTSWSGRRATTTFTERSPGSRMCTRTDP